MYVNSARCDIAYFVLKIPLNIKQPTDHHITCKIVSVLFLMLSKCAVVFSKIFYVYLLHYSYILLICYCCCYSPSLFDFILRFDAIQAILIHEVCILVPVDLQEISSFLVPIRAIICLAAQREVVISSFTEFVA